MHSVILTASCCECSGYTTCMDCNTTRELMKSHWTKTKISYMSCLPKHDISNTYLTENRAEFYANIIMICVENLALSYRFPTCMKFRFSSSGSLILSIRLELQNLSLTEATSLRQCHAVPNRALMHAVLTLGGAGLDIFSTACTAHFTSTIISAPSQQCPLACSWRG